MFILLLGGDSNFANALCGNFSQILDNGYTYQEIRTEILSCFYSNGRQFNWNRFTAKPNLNLLKQGQRYFHKELKITSTPPEVDYDINKGTMVSKPYKFSLEPRASYTLQEFSSYFYQTMPIDLQAHPPARMTGMLIYKINQYGIDKLLFMTDAYAEDCRAHQSVFNLGAWDNYSTIANQRLEEIKSNYSDNEPYYILKDRKLFNV